MRKQQTLNFALGQIVIILVIALYLVVKRNNAPSFIFWILMGVDLVYTSFLILFKRKNSVIFLAIFAISIGIIPIAYLYEVHYLEKDAIFESQFANSIIKNTKLDPTLGKGFAENYYGYNPLLHITIADLSVFSGLDPFFISKSLLPLIFRVIILILIFVIIKELTNDNLIASIASLLILISPAFIPISVSRRTMGQIFFLLSVYLLIKLSKENKFIYEIAFLISSFFIIVGDHSTSYIFIIFLISAFIFSLMLKLFLKLENTEIFRNLGFNFIVFLLMFLTWETLFAPVLLNTEIGYLGDIISFVDEGFGVTSVVGKDVYGPSAVHINKWYETFVAYSSQLLFLVFAFVGFVYLVYRHKKDLNNINKKMLMFLIVFGFFGYFFSGFLIRTRLNVLSSTLLWLFTIPIAISTAIIIIRMIQKNKPHLNTLALIFILFIFFGGLIIGFTPSITNRSFNEDIILGEPKSRSLELVYSADWLKGETENAFVFGDPTVFDIYSGFYQFDVSTDFETKRIYESSLIELNNILYGTVAFGNYKHTKVNDRLDFLVTNKAVFKYPSFIFNDALNDDNLEIFDNSQLLNKIYSNDEVNIYRNAI
ncbi:MAG TPA: hypothetical protein VJH20_03080 [Candidatus Nanoarchaeia archaeon]|nr:hypothetical protein [Candidatus Nanoarchaeia archaeon]